MSVKFSEISSTSLSEKIGAILFNISPILIILTWKFGPVQFMFAPVLGGIILAFLFALYGYDLWKKRENVLSLSIGLIFHTASILGFILFILVDLQFYNSVILLNLISFNLFVPVKNYEDMVNYVKTHQKTRGFETALILEDLPFKNNIVSPIDIAITKTLFLKFFTGDFYSSKQSAILSFNLSTVIMVYVSAFIPAGSSFPNLLILIFSYVAAFFIGLSIRTWIAASQFPEDLLLETKGYIRITDKPELIVETIRKGSRYNAIYGLVFALLALSLGGEPRPFTPNFGFDRIDWPSFLFFPLVLLFTYPLQHIWNTVVWGKLKMEVRSRTQKKRKKENNRRR